MVFSKAREFQMSYDEKTDKIDWKGEWSWLAASLISGIIMSLMFFIYNRFPGAQNYWRYCYSIGGNPFTGICSFHFIDICNQHEMTSGCCFCTITPSLISVGNHHFLAILEYPT